MKDSINFYREIYHPLFRGRYAMYADRSRLAIDTFDRYCSKNNIKINSVLDVGCAWGKALKRWKERGLKRVIGVDVSRRVTNYCKKMELDCLMASATDLSLFDDNLFDLYMATDVYEHLRTQDLDDAISEAKRVSKRYILIRPHFKMDKRGRRNPKKALHLTIWDRSQWKDFFLSHDLNLLPIGDDGELFYKNVFLMESFS